MAIPTLVLVLGGARSGKSSFAERLASHYTGDHGVLYLATAEASDAEMILRINRHRALRPPSWHTVEAPLKVAAAVKTALQQAPTALILLDCLTLLASNWLLAAHLHEIQRAEEGLYQELNALLEQVETAHIGLVVVSNEVGMGLVPPYPLGRVYRDLLGHLNQYLARKADLVYTMVAGLPLEVKALARSGVPWFFTPAQDQEDLEAKP
ncbi:bifunctional adenosylcobinamide kinase/adenosylcobinamide-phosphate guanylyltransferase [Anthocerotibacter panamensis]|uniref:bifunctional adenosylcobinamide kinase/adenosylcobinamide-phosphate guanylyltransferase n=1 Tax=Anthocerotibacter panamensis TaxID=2857077 RepID=UPI001C4016AB|nr:bifunctional adenosylcobinamide kinase/adenosylcobinamide-phosphate guanylyltransferase [Anthocerotibacter panamensis]